MSPKKRYTVSQTADSFLIKNSRHSLDVPGAPDWLVELAYDDSGIRRTPVTAVRHPYYCEVCWKSHRERLCFPNFYRLVECVASGLMAEWEPPDRSNGDEDDQPVLYPLEQAEKFLRPWAVKRTAWAINKLVHSEWNRLLGGVNEEVLKVQQKVLAASFGYEDSSLVMRPALYFEKHIVSDILKFRAAAIAALLCGRYEDPLLVMADWKSMFSPTGESYRSLNRTLMNLPGGVPPKVLNQLRYFELARPITSRIELITAIIGNCTRENRNGRIYMFAQQEQIREAMRRISRSTHRDLSWRRWRDVEMAINFIDDCPDEHAGNIVGLADRSIRWHRDELHEINEKAIKRYGVESEVARPAIPLPQDLGIRFLATVGDICEEAEKMEHCIASYVSEAMNGYSFLFHVEHGSESATVEVGHWGRVLQAVGPRNRDNAAAQWGRKILSRWARRLKRHRSKPQTAQQMYAV